MNSIFNTNKIKKSLVFLWFALSKWSFFDILFGLDLGPWPYTLLLKNLTEFFFLLKQRRKEKVELLTAISTYMLFFLKYIKKKTESCGTGFKKFKRNYISCFECNRKPSDSINESEFVAAFFFFFINKTSLYSFIEFSSDRLVIWITKKK